jgi:hypothetical protein
VRFTIQGVIDPQKCFRQYAKIKAQSSSGKYYANPEILSVTCRLECGEGQRLVTVRTPVGAEPGAGFYINLRCLGRSNFESSAAEALETML